MPESIDPLRRAVELDPANFIAHWCLGYASSSVGDLTPAFAEVSWLVAAGPHVPYTIQLQSLVRAQLGDTQQALAPTRFIAVHCRFLESLRSHARITPIVATASAMSAAIRREVEASLV